MMTTKIAASLRAVLAGLALAFLILPAAPLGRYGVHSNRGWRSRRAVVPGLPIRLPCTPGPSWQ